MNAIESCFISNHLDRNNIPTSGYASGEGISISWQNGPLGRGKDRKTPNGAFVETVIDIAKNRLEFYQLTEFNCVA